MTANEIKPRLLDLFCCAGGAARGYQMAGFHVTGIDIAPQPRYAGDVFIWADALEYVEAHGQEYDVIHASPPCQAYRVWPISQQKNIQC
jgi:site-specific DNA-cytosine methylase